MMAFVQRGWWEEKELDREMKITHARVLKQKGFDNVVFLLVEVRPRDWLEYFLYDNVITTEEKRKRALDPNFDIFNPILRDRLYSKYKIDSLTPNKVLESLLRKGSNYFADVINSDFYDCYFAYVPSQRTIFLLKSTIWIKNNTKSFLEILLSDDIIKDLDARDNFRDKQFQSLNDQLYLEGLGLSFLQGDDGN
ncbi:MAG TPA: hypothetical protein VGD89_00625 [Flavipsychrobacter sp.]